MVCFCQTLPLLISVLSVYTVPGSSQKFLDKSRTLTADCVTYDLEDSVTPNRKSEARSLVRKALDQSLPTGIKERAVRINSVSSGLALKDLTTILQSPNLTTLVVPKVDSPSDLTFISDVIAHSRPTDQFPTKSSPITILALIESARSLTSLSQITSAVPHLLSGLIFAAEDFALDLSLTRTPDLKEFLFARSAIVTAARAANLPSTIDLVCTSFKSEADHEILANECRDGKRMGFNGKQCIHPGQASTVNKVFSPELEEVEWAVRVTIAQKRAEEMGKGAWALDGKMIDAPVEGKARAVVKRAELCEFDVKALQEKFRDQLPE
jgi:citrate lyase subunit beta-like protein